MINPLFAYVEGLLRSAAIGPVLWLTGLALFVFVMSRNWRHLKREELPFTLDEGEREIDAIRVGWPLLRTHTSLTSRRVMQDRFSWFLSKRKTKAISLDDVHSIVWRRYVNWYLLMAGLLFLNGLNPVAFLFLLFGLQSKVYSVRFATPFAQMPYTRVVVTTSTRRQLVAVFTFYKRALELWSRMIVEKRLAAAVGSNVPTQFPPRPAPPDIGLVENDFAWGAPLLAWVCIMMALCFSQRILEPHISFDDYVFGPLYIGLVAAVASGHRRDGLWLALLGFVGVFTLKFPGSGLASLVTDGGSPLFEEYFVIVLVLLGIAGVAALLGRILPILVPLSVLLWALVPLATSTGIVTDLSFVAKMLTAMGWASALMVVDQTLRERFVRREELSRSQA